jgi:hypothetical protein
VKSPQTIKFRAKIELTDHPEIHPEDAENAIRAWFQRTSKDRRKPPGIILEKLLIASALNDNDGHQVLPPVWKDGKEREIKRGNDGFETRWKRAQKDGRAPIWDKIDFFMLKNWRVMRLGPGFARVGCPGLIEWNPRAACALIRALPIGEKSGDETWYRKKRNRLNLKGKRRYRVKDFFMRKDGACGLDLD